MSNPNEQHGDEITRNLRLTLAVLLLGVALTSLMQVIVALAFPAFMSDFAIGADRATWTITIFILTYTVSMPILGKLSDIFGRRLVFVLGTAVFAIGTTACAVAPSFEALVVARAIQGLGGGGLFPIALAVVGNSFPRSRQGTALGAVTAMYGVATVLGIIIAGPILDNLGWRWLFGVISPLAAVTFGLALTLPRDGQRDVRPAVDYLGAIVLSGTLLAVILGMSELGNAKDILASSVWPYFTAMVLGIPLFVAVELRSPDPVISIRTFRHTGIALANAIALTATFGQLCLIIFLPTFFKMRYSLSAGESSLALLPMVLGMAAASGVTGALLNRVGAKRLTIVGLLIFGAAMSVLSFSLATWELSQVLAALTVAGIGLGLQMAPVNHIVLLVTPPEEQGQASSTVTMSRSLAGIFAGATGGLVMANYASNIGRRAMEALKPFLPPGMPPTAQGALPAAGNVTNRDVMATLRAMIEALPPAARTAIEPRLPDMQAAVDQAVRSVFVDAIQQVVVIGLIGAGVAVVLAFLLRPKYGD